MDFANAEEHRPPQWDALPVLEATVEDLDSILVSKLILRQKQYHPRIFGSMSDEKILENMRVIQKVGNTYHPTMAGLLALGTYPQKYFPRLVATFAAYPDSQAKKLTGDKALRTVDNQTMVGAIPYIVQDILDAVRKNKHTGEIIEGAFRKDLPDYPLDAVREAIVNALQHRDYSDVGQASPVHVAMYPDRLQITNPGELDGNMTAETLGKGGITGTRNPFPSSILEATPLPDGHFVAENRGNGFAIIQTALDEADMLPADIQSTPSTFSITFQLRRRTDAKTKSLPGKALGQAILDALKKAPSLSTAEIIAASGMSRATVNNHLRKLVDQGLIEPTEPAKSPKQRYRLKKTC
jgi:ATP-dependent DNA helicase RecG